MAQKKHREEQEQYLEEVAHLKESVGIGEQMKYKGLEIMHSLDLSNMDAKGLADLIDACTKMIDTGLKIEQSARKSLAQLINNPPICV